MWDWSDIGCGIGGRWDWREMGCGRCDVGLMGDGRWDV